jgi:hypothetical protein
MNAKSSLSSTRHPPDSCVPSPNYMASLKSLGTTSLWYYFITATDWSNIIWPVICTYLPGQVNITAGITRYLGRRRVLIKQLIWRWITFSDVTSKQQYLKHMTSSVSITLHNRNMIPGKARDSHPRPFPWLRVRRVNLIFHVNPVPRLRKRGVLLTFPHASSWRSA